jgi:hypothetical protein
MRTQLLGWIALTAYLTAYGPLCSHVQAQPAIQVRVDAVVSGTVGGTMTFSYDVTNLTSSQRAIGKILLPVVCGSNPVVVTSIASTRPWIGAALPGRQVTWAVGDETASLSPGQTVRGFSVSATALPAPCSIAFQPFLDYRNVGVPVPDFEGDFSTYFRQVQKVATSLTTSVPSVGPIPLPAAQGPIAFLNSIIQYEAIAEANRWISSGFGQSVQSKLAAARAQLVDGQRQVAANILFALANELAGHQPDSVITTEGTALIELNVRFLLSLL